MIDVDCKDRTLGMSCPPPAFVEPTFIEILKASLTSDGNEAPNLSIQPYRFTIGHDFSLPTRSLSFKLGVS